MMDDSYPMKKVLGINAGWQVKRSLASRLTGKLRETRDDAAPRLIAPDLRPDKDLQLPRPIFIIGCQRSGTSLLRRILDCHSHIACPPESHFVLPMIEVLRNQKSLVGLGSMGYERKQVELSLARFIASFFEGYAAARGKERWADKTPHYVDCLPELWQLFGPEAKFILLIRHGLDVAFSLADADRHYGAVDEHVARCGGNVALGAALFWAEQNEKIDDFRKANPQACFVLRYEELTTDPEATLQAMFSFLDEAWEPSVVDYNQSPHHSGLEDCDVRRRRKIEPNSGRYMAWPIHVQQTIKEACEPMLSKLGYE